MNNIDYISNVLFTLITSVKLLSSDTCNNNFYIILYLIYLEDYEI